VVVASVDRASPAAAAGLKPGDHIHRFGNWNVNSPEGFRAMVLAAKNPVIVRVERPGSDEPIETKLTLLGSPSRLGITWRTDDAEPGVPILSRVLAGSPADLAGLRAGDRIHRIGGHEFASADEFRELAATLAGPIELAVETAGRVRTVTLLPADATAEPALGDEPKSAAPQSND
jgi:S1-C subfamily serine protease